MDFHLVQTRTVSFLIVPWLLASSEPKRWTKLSGGSFLVMHNLPVFNPTFCCCSLVTKSCLILLQPHGLWSLPGSSTTEPAEKPTVQHLVIVESKKESVSGSGVSNSLWPQGLCPARLLCPWGFSRQEHWSGQPFPSPGDLLNPGIKPGWPALQADFLLFTVFLIFYRKAQMKGVNYFIY